MSRRALVVGGGIAGLSAAYEFQQAGWTVDVHEATGRWGGKILTSDVGDRLVDSGPDAILARAAAGMELVRQLGLADDIVHPVSNVPAYICLDGRLHELPEGTVFGIPTDPSVLHSTELLSEAGKQRAAQDLELPVEHDDTDDDPSVGKVCRQRLGDELTDRLIAPLIGGINASNIDRLSMRSAAPQLTAALAQHGSLIRGMAALRQRAGATLGTERAAPVFFSLPGGVQRIIDALVEHLANPKAGHLPAADLKLNSPVDLSTLPELANQLDAVVLATAPVEAMNYASVSQVTVEVSKDALEAELDTSGILFPATGGTHLTACTWLSSKWSHYHHDDSVLLRLTSGRYGDDRANNLDDDTLVATLLDELQTAVPIDGPPQATRIQRWPNALPQYEPGHRNKVETLRSNMTERHPNVTLVGAAYDGIGIPACIESGRNGARQLITPQTASQPVGSGS